MSANGTALCCIDFEHVKELSHQWKKDAECQVYTFGEDADSDFRIVSREATPKGQTVQVSSKDFGDFSYTTALSGNYNARNATAVMASCLVNGFSIDETTNAITKLKGVKRRQETRFDQGGYTLIEDFAHHPTSVAETISVMKEIYPDRRLLVAFEPRSAASRRKVFQQDYINAFAMADAAAISAIEQISYDAGHELLDINQLAQDISATGTPCKALDGAEIIAEELLSLLGKDDVILVMSNGSFGGLIDILESRLKDLSK
jgi:UDP-N-acetylmuramate: L-alanyl-gamma-D-glutamyl-meso-diaminopimelate ligase